MIALELRPYQADALRRVETAVANGQRRLLGVAATGLGKTVMFCALAERIGGRTLILAHRDELIAQAVAKVRQVCDADVGVVKADRNEVHATIVVASVQTLARRSRLEQLVDAAEALWHEPFRLVVIDEAHHSVAPSYQRIVSALNAGQPGGPLLFGVTATPDRGDGAGLDGMFDEIAFSYDLLWGIQAGYLADVRALAIKVAIDMGQVAVRRGDYDAGQTGALLGAADAHHHIVDAWLVHAQHRPTIVFTPTVAFSERVAAAFREAGVAAAHLDGATPLGERRDCLDRFARKAITVVSNCAVLTEGFDAPHAACIVIARPTRSRALYTQMVGRGTRRHPDKTDCLVIDVVGVTDQHKLVTIPTLFGLEGVHAQRASTGVHRVSQIVAEQTAAHARVLQAVEVELFERVRAEGIAWVAIHEHGERRCYQRSLGRDRPVVLISEHASESWAAELLHPDGSRQVLMRDVSMELAQGVAEDYIRKNGPRALTHSDAAWRNKKPTQRQLEACRRWRIEVPQGATAGEVSDLLDRRISRTRRRAS